MLLIPCVLVVLAFHINVKLGNQKGSLWRRPTVGSSPRYHWWIDLEAQREAALKQLGLRS